MLLILKRVSILLLTIWLGLLLSSCGSQEPIKIGFAGELTGRQLAVGARNGVKLAVEEINANGGIKGRRVELLIEDDQGKPDMARQADQRLVEAGVVAIIGHVTSGQAAAVLEQMNEARVVLLSPTASSIRFSDQEDYFFRVANSSDKVGAALAQYAYHSMQLRQVSGIYDLDNAAFSQTFWEAFVTQFEALGGEIEQDFSYSSRKDDLALLAEDVIATEPSALLFIASAVDTALLAQHISSLEGKKPTLLSSSWGQAEQLLAKGGQTVEGMALAAVYDIDNPNPEFQEFVQAFEERYSHKPNAAAAFSYEAMQVLAEALKQTNGQAEGLSGALISIQDFPVIQGNLSMNEYGDVERDVYIAVVEEGQYKIIEKVSNNELVME